MRAYQKLSELEQKQRKEFKAMIDWYTKERGVTMIDNFDEDREEALFDNRYFLERYREHVKEKENG